MAKYVVNGLSIPLGVTRVELDNLVAEWNAHVDAGDTVYILGNITSFGAGSVKLLLTQVNGELILIRGKQDVGLIVSDLVIEGVLTLVSDIGVKTYQDAKVYFLTHYPLVIEPLDNALAIHWGSELDYLKRFSISGGLYRL